MQDFAQLFKQPAKNSKNDMSGLESQPIPDELNWISFIETLSQGDITRDETIWKMNYRYSLTRLLLWRLRDDAYEQQNKMNR